MSTGQAAKGQWQCSAAGKVTVGLALHWPCVKVSESVTVSSSVANALEVARLMLGHFVLLQSHDWYTDSQPTVLESRKV